MLEGERENLQFHPGEEVSDLSPTSLLFQNNAHVSESQLRDEASHRKPHIATTFSLLRQTSHRLNRCDDMLPVHLAVPVILQILNHLLRGPLNPLGSHGVRALVPPQRAQVLCLLLYDSPRVVVR